MRTLPLRKLLSPSRPLTYGIVQAGPHIPDGVPYVRPVDMTATSGVANEDLLQRTSRSIASSYERASLREGDVVLSIGPSFGKVMLVPPSLEGANLTQGTARLATGPDVDARWLYWILQSRTSTSFWEAVVAGGTFRALNLGPLGETPVALVDHDQQRRIADFLDDRASRIDRIIATRREQMELASQSRSRLSYDVVRGSGLTGERRDSHLDWLGEIPAEWGVLSVGSQFTVELGKMLDDKRQTGAHSLPYLRNTNVQWDAISVDDLKEMDISEDEYPRYTVEVGDLLICEGGQPGRSAIWDGRVEPLGFQKALHRARSRGRSLSGWLLECLRVAVELDVFAAASGQTTIAHLTNEQLRGQRFPFPERDVQVQLLEELETQRASMTSIIDALAGSIELLTEYKSSLITAAVTGELDVSTAGSSIPG